jgi:quercetin dioxygenase-like cupin family protein
MKNIPASFKQITAYFSPKVVAEVNNHYIKLAKIKGEEIPWHSHQNEDEAFYVIAGTLLMEIEGQAEFTMSPGDMHVVKKGILHRVSAEKECQIMLFEPQNTKHTGDIKSSVTKTIEDQLK